MNSEEHATLSLKTAGRSRVLCVCAGGAEDRPGGGVRIRDAESRRRRHRRHISRSTKAGAGRRLLFAASAKASCFSGKVAVWGVQGGSHDRTTLLPLKAGVAVMAVNALKSGAEDVLIVPVGLTYHNPHKTQSRASVTIGEPIPVSLSGFALLAADAGETRLRGESLWVEPAAGQLWPMCRLACADNEGPCLGVRR